MRDQRQLPVVVLGLLLGTLVCDRNSCFLECDHLCYFCHVSFLLFFLPLLGPSTRRKAAVVSKSNFCFTLRFSLLSNHGTRIGINKYASAVAIDMTGCRVSMARFSLNFFREFKELGEPRHCLGP